MEILFFVFSCLLMLTNHLHQFCSEAATSNLEYPYPFMTADAKKAAARTYDYIVVGGGAAGCPLAATLSQKYSVLLLERGDSPYGNPDVEEFEKLYSLFGDATDFPYVAEAFYSEDGVQLARGRVLGGGTAINGGFYSRARSEDIREMKWDEKLVNESYEWVEKSFIFKQYKLFPWNSAFKNGLLEVGVLPYHGYTLDHLEGTKISGSIFDKNGKRHTAADLLQHANPENIVVLLNATASRILFNSVSGKLKASGVEFNNNDGALPYQVSLNQLSTNSEVILSAGSIGSPQLLLLSGIGPKEQLKKLNITVLLDLPLVGKNVQDNPSTGFLLESPKPLEFAYSQVVGILDDSQVYMEGGSYIQQNITSIQHLGLVRGKVAFPISRGDLWLKSIDPQDNPYVRYNYYSHPFDLKKCMFCVKVMINLSMSSPIQQFAFTNNKHMKTLQYAGTSLPNNPLNNSALAQYCNDTLDTYNHYHGGCQVGLVVDRRYQVKGVDNLRVVDGSIFKDSLGTNPQGTILMLGRYMGIQILQERTKP